LSRVEVVKDMPAADYHAAPGLSHSAMKDLIVSPFRFWHRQINPERPEKEETEFMIFGRALHKATLEPDTFDAEYACAYIAPEGALETIQDMREWYLATTGKKACGTAKEAVAAQCRLILDHPPIVMDEEKVHRDANAGKCLLKADDWYRLAGCARALRREPEFQRLTEKGNAEVSYFVTDPDTGILLKARMDFVAKDWTLDPKTYSQKGKPINQTVADAIFYEGYHRQSYLYTTIREIAGEGTTQFINPFVESEEPHEVRIRRHMQNSLLWDTGRSEVIRLIRLYANLMERFGPDKPWRTDADVEDLMDEEIRSLPYA
jgi:hypothetical protein